MHAIKLPTHKTASLYPIIKAPIAKQLYFPINQQQLLIKPGEYVSKGQCIALATNPQDVTIHASSSGIFQGIVTYGEKSCLQIVTDGNDTWCKKQPIQDYQQLSPAECLKKITDAGIIGLGGAGFNTANKISATHSQKNNSPNLQLIINGVECEPYICTDDSLMQHHSEEVIRGIEIVCHILRINKATLAIENDKPAALQAVRAINSLLVDIVAIPTFYPAGSEKQLIATLLNREIPSGLYPSDVGIICLNVATVAAIYHAIIKDEPLFSRITTLTGNAVLQPRNVEVLIGTPVADLLALVEIKNSSALCFSQGGNMMPLQLTNAHTPILKTSNCILINEENTVPPNESPCIRCGACNTVCPAHLLPEQLYWHSKSQHDEKLQQLNLFDCIECGCCDYVCPSHIPLTDYYRQAKIRIKQQQDEKNHADLAKQRFEARETRLSSGNDIASEKRLAIQQALARARQRKEK